LGYENQTKEFKYLQAIKTDSNLSVIEAVYQDNDEVQTLRKGWLYSEAPKELLFTGNETNKKRFGWGENSGPVKDGISIAVCQLVHTILRNEKQIFPVSVRADSRYGVGSEVVFGLPCIISSIGIERQLVLPRNAHEQRLL